VLQPNVAEVRFRFDALNHEYIDTDTGVVLPHITGMLEQTGWIDNRWYTPESCERGHYVHRLTADYDLGALTDVKGCTSAYKGWLLAHVKVMSMVRPQIIAVEEADVHPKFRYGGRPDRLEIVYGVKSVVEVKSGLKEKSHGIQLALQAMLAERRFGIPARAIGRYCLYLKGTGRGQLYEHKDKGDYAKARKVIRECTGI
jgi:hypothetical protein